jgi:hypothetical protein
MIGLLRPDTLWLITVNVLLGLAIIVCSVMIAWSFLNEIRSHRKKRKDEAKVPDDYLKGLKDLGVTLPDGGKKIDEMDEKEKR